MAYTATREQAHELIDRIGPEQVAAAVEMLERLVDPVSLAELHAEPEDELLSEEETRRLAEVRAGRYDPSETSHEDLLKEFGLTPDSWKHLDLDREPSSAVVARP